ncbi:flavin-dependent oxidoreductase [Dongia rigui]|uniref:Flavin-dependent oxidoreductase n=1 Tax=Dongia rigui TaxID=940149 RepID=A0ABU5DVM2_9PROT|nr:flavin-dependent oxidoreductase [Dongia rigui]MDY0871347.1 flavin-dependent oxidoreductase [Dongia rigui]
MRVAVIGGGIGGLTTALSLHAAGIEVELFESVAELQPLGVGINLLPHAVRELTELGLGEALAKIGLPPQELIYVNRFGQEIWREQRGCAAGYLWPQISLHRGRLQLLLLETARARLGSARLHLGQRLMRVVAGAGSATAFFEKDAVTADVVIAADGIHSAARAQFFPQEGAPIWNHRILWRGVSHAAPFAGGRAMVMAGHQAQKFVCYPIAENDGVAEINWIAELSFAEGHPWRREDWNRSADLNDFLPAFADWRFGWLDVPALIGAATRVFEYPMVDRDPLPRWTFGRVTLLGDAAHPMYPIGSNGASQAILDARHIAYALATSTDIDAALAQYEAARRPATSQIVLANRGNGPEQVMQIAHERAPGGFNDIGAVIPRSELEEIAGRYKIMAGFDKETLNSRPSLTPPRAAG